MTEYITNVTSVTSIYECVAVRTCCCTNVLMSERVAVRTCCCTNVLLYDFIYRSSYKTKLPISI